MSVLELNGRVFDASTTGTLTLTSEGGAATTDVTQGLAKAWIDHTQITTSAIRDSLNISSITDVATGKTFPIAFTNNMSSSSYAGSLYASANTSDGYTTFNNQLAGGLGSKTTASFGHSGYSTGFVDSIRNDDIIQGDLA